MPIHQLQCDKCGYLDEYNIFNSEDKEIYDNSIGNGVYPLCPKCLRHLECPKGEEGELKPVIPLSNFKMTGF